MDNTNAFTFVRNARTRFFLCRSCQNHVLSGNDISAVSFSTSGYRSRILCRNPVNVRVQHSDVMFFRYLPHAHSWSQDLSQVGYNTYPMTTMDLDIHCNACNVCLGRRSYLLPLDGPGVPHPIVSDIMWNILQLDQLLYWNGTRMVYADTHKPAYPNPD